MRALVVLMAALVSGCATASRASCPCAAAQIAFAPRSFAISSHA